MARIIWVAAQIALIGVTGSATAQEAAKSAAYRQAMNNLAHEHATCVSYYAIAQGCFGPKLDEKAKASVQASGAEAITRGKQYTTEAGLLPETFMARIKMASDQQTKALQQNCSNISLLLAEHAEQCKSLLEDPVPVFERYLDQAIAQGAKK